ncbi:MAG: peptidylprolyl isomerase [Pyrinomonadaceae bacterium]|nr:peptidylprolyl isomerase [Pyrinomonadaceae bacterium]
MKKILILCFVLCFSVSIFAQIPVQTLVQISKAEDELRFDKTLENLLKNPNPKIRARSALAAGRIGNETAIPQLVSLLQSDKDTEVRAMSAFALGEIESMKAADAILSVLGNIKNDGTLRAKSIEAAGKIAAANANDERSKELSKAIVGALEFEVGRRSAPNIEAILKGLTAVLRVRPEKGEKVVAEFLTYGNARVRADAGNTLARLRAKNANETLRTMLQKDTDAVVRANAARVLGAAEDKDSLEILLTAVVKDSDSRVRISAIRALGSLKDKKAAEKLIERGNFIYSSLYGAPTFAPKKGSPSEKNELFEIATVLGRLLAFSNDAKAVSFIKTLRKLDNYLSPETEIALARIAPKDYFETFSSGAEVIFTEDWRTASAVFQGLGEIAALESNKENDALKSQTRLLLVQLISIWLTHEQKDGKMNLAIPDLFRAFAAFKSENTSGILRPILEAENDLFIRAAIAEILGDQTPSKENFDALKKAFNSALLKDKNYNDAQLAILDALFKIDKKESGGILLTALNASDYLVRKKAFDLLSDRNFEILREENESETEVQKYIESLINKSHLFPYQPKSGTKLGQILNSNADYVRAVSRKNGTVKAIFTTEKGNFTIDLVPEDAPLTVDNFIKLAKSNYFNGLAVHRVVPNFVMQDGDPRGDGNGGPGWQIRCEINMLEYERGAVGMALSGKDTGGSQWFVTHSPQPHLDGGYTVFGKVNESDMKIVDSIVRGDRILSVKIIEVKAVRKK